MTQRHQYQSTITGDLAGLRLDQALAKLFPQFSRARLQRWLAENAISVDGATGVSAKTRVVGGENVVVDAVLEQVETWQPQKIDLAIVHEDPDIIVINKPPNRVVHPAAGNREGTLLNALLHHSPQLAALPRAGIVHRLDKDTSGLLVVAKTLAAHTHLVRALQARTVKREYDAIVVGEVISGGTVTAPMGRHPVDRKRMAVIETGKTAVTHYRVHERFAGYTWLRVSLETGRTHQIRVHLAHIRFPIVGDPVYGGRLKIPPGASDGVRNALRGFKRQALHAARLGLEHPTTGEWCEWKVAPPPDFLTLVEVLRQHGA